MHTSWFGRRSFWCLLVLVALVGSVIHKACGGSRRVLGCWA